LPQEAGLFYIRHSWLAAPPGEGFDEQNRERISDGELLTGL